MREKLSYEVRKQHIRESHKKWARKNPKKLAYYKSQQYKDGYRDRRLAAQKRYRIKNRSIVLSHYGRSCTCCGENREEFLGIDHIGGGGRRHKKQIHNKLYPWLIRNNFPLEFRILCHNCNQSIGAYGYCPHQKEKDICSNNTQIVENAIYIRE